MLKIASLTNSIASLVVALVLAACSTTGTIAYMPAAPPAAGPPNTVSAVTVIDRRDEKPNRLATVRGGFGNPAGVLDTPQPVATLVQAVFTEALQRRRMLAPSGPVRFQVTLDTFYGNEYLVGKAELKMVLAVYGPSNQVIYQDAVTDRSDAKLELSFDSTSTRVEKLRRDVETLLSRNVDRLLDKPTLTTALNAANNRPPT